MLKDRLMEVEEKIQAACERSGRKRSDVTLVAVSKTKPAFLIQEAYEYGLRDFGENKVQEFVQKYPALPQDIRWHLIGHLQTNKVRFIIGKTALIHSVDSQKLAEVIEKEAAKREKIVEILLEVNVAGEESKFGLAVGETLPLVRKIALFPHIKVRGLMTVAPYVADPEENRAVFAKLRQLSVDIANQNIDNVNISLLSMGMTNDYEIAIEEGATIVRVGTGIFGERHYSDR